MTDPTQLIIQFIPMLLKYPQRVFMDDIVFEIQGFSFVKSGGGSIKKLHLSFAVFNNQGYKIFRKMQLIYNGKILKPKQQFKFVTPNLVDSYKPIQSFILGEKETKEFNIEFESNDQISLDQNNNAKIEIEAKNNKKYFCEFGVVLDEINLKLIQHFSGNENAVLFRANPFTISEL